MEKITTEKYLATLFRYGFEQVDPVLYTLTLGALSDEELIPKDEFDFSSDEPLSVYFKEYFESDGITYKIKKDKDYTKYFKCYSSDKLLNALDNLDYGKIISRKLKLYGISIAEMDDDVFFSSKEKEIMSTYIDKNQPWFKRITLVSKEKMRTSPDYIEWVIGYAKKQEFGKFTSIDWLPDSISKEDRANISKLGIFLRSISEYITFEPNVYNINNVLLEYNGDVIKISELFYQGTINSAEIITDEKAKENAIDFNAVMDFYKKQKEARKLKKTIQKKKIFKYLFLLSYQLIHILELHLNP